MAVGMSGVPAWLQAVLAFALFLIGSAALAGLYALLDRPAVSHFLGHGMHDPMCDRCMRRSRKRWAAHMAKRAERYNARIARMRRL